MLRKFVATLALVALMSASAVAQTPNGSACKINQRNWCGSGSLCGYGEYNGQAGAFILTNAHVSGTSLQDPMDCLFKLPSGAEKLVRANPIIIAYTRNSVDWAIGFTTEIQPDSGLEPVKLSKEGPVGSSFTFTGSPRCVWPQQTVQISLSPNPPSGVVWWTPNAIGGQSGSSVWRPGRNGKPQAEILLTWTYGSGAGARGAGQPTRLIYNNMVNKSADGPEPVDGLVEVGVGAWEDRDLQEGYFEADTTTKILGLDPIERAIKVQELPIWVTDEDDDGGDDDDDDGDDGDTGLSADELKAVMSIREHYDLISVAGWLNTLRNKRSGTADGPVTVFPSEQTEDLPDTPPPASVDKAQAVPPAGPEEPVWEPPADGVDLYEGMEHNGRVLTKVCDPETGTCTYEWKLK